MADAVIDAQCPACGWDCGHEPVGPVAAMTDVRCSQCDEEFVVDLPTPEERQ